MGIAADFGSASSASSSTEPRYKTLAEYNYVQGDTGPQLRFVFTDEDARTPASLDGATVTLYMRAKGTTEVIRTRPLYINPETAASGEAIVVWQEGDLDLAPGQYEGEIEVVRATGVRETLFDVLLFNIRSDFA